VSVNRTLEMGGSLSCTVGKCSLSLRSGGDMTSSGTVSCSGNSECLLDVACGSSAVLSGSMTGSDIRMVVAESLQLAGTVSTNGQGYVEKAGEGQGNQPSGSSSDTYYRVSGSGAGHGGDGAAACFRYSTSYGTLPSGTVRPCMMITIILARMLAVQSQGPVGLRLVCIEPGGESYGSSSFPRTFGSGGGRSCYRYTSCSYYGKGGSGGGRIYMNASSIEIASVATVSADGAQGLAYSGSRYRDFVPL